MTRDDVLGDALRERLASRPQIVLGGCIGEADIRTLGSRPHDELVLIDGASYRGRATSILARIGARDPGRKALLLHPACTDALVDHVLRCGGSGCLSVEATGPELARAIQAVHAGELWASRKVLTQAIRPVGDEALTAHPILSARESEIIAGMRRGMSNKQIARELGISDMTVKTHAHNIFGKLGVSGRVRLMALPA